MADDPRDFFRDASPVERPPVQPRRVRREHRALADVWLPSPMMFGGALATVAVGAGVVLFGGRGSSPAPVVPAVATPERVALAPKSAQTPLEAAVTPRERPERAKPRKAPRTPWWAPDEPKKAKPVRRAKKRTKPRVVVVIRRVPVRPAPRPVVRARPVQPRIVIQRPAPVIRRAAPVRRAPECVIPPC